MKNIKYILALMILTISLLANWYFYSQLQTTDKTIDDLKQDKQVIKQQYELMRRDVQRIQENFNALKHPDNQSIALKGTTQHPAASAVIYRNPTTQKLYLDANGLPNSMNGLQYQLWARMAEGQPYKSLGVFNYQADKDNFFHLKYIKDVAHFVVSLEKPTGSEQPTIGRIYVEK